LIEIFDLPRIIISNIYKVITRIRVFNTDKIPQDTSVIFTFNHIAGAAYIIYKLKWPIVPVYIHNMFKGPGVESFIGRNEWTKGMTAMIINIGRRINVVVGNPMWPTSFIKSKKPYKKVAEDINNSLFEAFLRLEKDINNVIRKT